MPVLHDSLLKTILSNIHPPPFFSAACLSPSYSPTLKYGQRHQAWVSAIAQLGDSRFPLLLMQTVPYGVRYKYVQTHIKYAWLCTFFMHICTWQTTQALFKHKGMSTSLTYGLNFNAAGKPECSPPRPKFVRSFGPPELLLTGRLVAGQESANQG